MRKWSRHSKADELRFSKFVILVNKFNQQYSFQNHSVRVIKAGNTKQNFVTNKFKGAVIISGRRWGRRETIVTHIFFYSTNVNPKKNFTQPCGDE